METQPTPKRKISNTLAILIVMMGLLGGAAFVWGQYMNYREGTQLKLRSLLLPDLPFLVCLGFLMLGAIFAGLLACAYRHYKPLFACIIAPFAWWSVAQIHVPTYGQGVAERIAAEPESFYVELAKELRKTGNAEIEYETQPVPQSAFQKFSKLRDFFPPPMHPMLGVKLELSPEYVEVSNGSLRAGGGFRVYDHAHQTPKSDASTVLTQIYPNVYAIARNGGDGAD